MPDTVRCGAAGQHAAVYGRRQRWWYEPVAFSSHSVTRCRMHGNAVCRAERVPTLRMPAYPPTRNGGYTSRASVSTASMGLFHLAPQYGTAAAIRACVLADRARLPASGGRRTGMAVDRWRRAGGTPPGHHRPMGSHDQTGTVSSRLVVHPFPQKQRDVQAKEGTKGVAAGKASRCLACLRLAGEACQGSVHRSLMLTTATAGSPALSV